MGEIEPFDSGGSRHDERRGRRLRRNVVAVGTALGLTLGGLGSAAAQTGQNDGSTTTTAPADGDRPGRPERPLGAGGTEPGHHRGPGPGLAAAAEAIGISQDELRTALESGQSIAQVAESKGVAVQAVIDAMVADAREHLAEKVASGDLTQTEADERLAGLQERITDLVNRTGGLRGPGG